MIVKNSAFNLVAAAIPGAVFFLSTHFLSKQLDISGFGIYVLALSILGYSGLFEAGVGRGVIRALAKNGKKENERAIITTALYTVITLSMLATVSLYFFSSEIVIALNIDASLKLEAVNAIKLLSISPPVVFSSIVLKSFFEGKGNFSLLSKLNIFTGSLILAFPALTVCFYPSLFFAIIGLIIGQVLSLFVYIFFFTNKVSAGRYVFCKEIFGEIFVFGKWIFVSNIIGSAMVYCDRFILSNISGSTSVSFYTAPVDLLLKVAVVPQSISRVLFYSYSRSEEKKVRVNAHYLFLICVLICILLPIFFFAENILGLWLGADYADNSTDILKICIVGFFFNSLAQIPFSRLHSSGLSKQTAVLHLCELIPYLMILFVLINKFGIVGAAIAWSVRTLFDFLALEVLCFKYFNKM